MKAILKPGTLFIRCISRHDFQKAPELSFEKSGGEFVACRPILAKQLWTKTWCHVWGDDVDEEDEDIGDDYHDLSSTIFLHAQVQLQNSNDDNWKPRPREVAGIRFLNECLPLDQDFNTINKEHKALWVGN